MAGSMPPATTNAAGLYCTSKRLGPAAAAPPRSPAGDGRHGAILGEASGTLLAIGTLCACVARTLQNLAGDQSGILADGTLDLLCDLRVLFQILLGVLATLADALAIEGEPGARFLDDAGLYPEIDQLSDLGDTLAIHDVE